MLERNLQTAIPRPLHSTGAPGTGILITGARRLANAATRLTLSTRAVRTWIRFFGVLCMVAILVTTNWPFDGDRPQVVAAKFVYSLCLFDPQQLVQAPLVIVLRVPALQPRIIISTDIDDVLLITDFSKGFQQMLQCLTKDNDSCHAQDERTRISLGISHFCNLFTHAV